jgi:hypothetical protein
MKAPEESFQSFLWQEADTQGRHYQEALEKLFSIAERDGQPGSDLLDAAQMVKENLRLYTGALRRIANVAAHKLTPSPKHLVGHA